MIMQQYEFWFVVGSQFLYGQEVLDTVAARGAEMAEVLSSSGLLPCRVVYKLTAKTSREISGLVREANHDPRCAGLITWCHTFSPSKMWIDGLASLQKPYCHLATQYNREIPDNEIDMDFMNLNQAAHGDREHGFIAARLRKPRKVIAGFWRDEKLQRRLGSWMRAAVGVMFSRELKVMRFGDNMREVAVTEGDKVEAQLRLGWEVNTWPVGLLAETMEQVSGLDSVNAIVVYPEGVEQAWAPAPYAATSGEEDLGFARVLLDHVRDEYPVDGSRIFATGFSNGGGFAAYLGCHLPETFHAVAPVGAAYYEAIHLGCTTEPVARLDIHGTDDRTIHYYGGTRHGERYEPVPVVLDRVAENNGCTRSTMTRRSQDVIVQHWQGCRLPLVHVRVGGGAHVWPKEATAELRAFFGV